MSSMKQRTREPVTATVLIIVYACMMHAYHLHKGKSLDMKLLSHRRTSKYRVPVFHI